MIIITTDKYNLIVSHINSVVRDISCITVTVNAHDDVNDGRPGQKDFKMQ